MPNIDSTATPRNGFFCYASENDVKAHDFRERFERQIRLEPGFDLAVWSDRRLVAGQRWDDVIRGEATSAELGVVNLSPAMLDSHYINEVELPLLQGGKPAHVVPVGLCWVNINRVDLRCLTGLQIYRWKAPSGVYKFYEELRGNAQKERFVEGFVDHVVESWKQWSTP